MRPIWPKITCFWLPRSRTGSDDVAVSQDDIYTTQIPMNSLFMALWHYDTHYVRGKTRYRASLCSAAMRLVFFVLLVLCAGTVPSFGLEATNKGLFDWKLDHVGNVQAAIVTEIHVYAYTSASIICALHAESGQIVWRHSLGTPVQSMHLGDGGRLLLSLSGGSLYMWEAENGALSWVANQGGDTTHEVVWLSSALYMLQGDNGVLKKFDAYTGDILWTQALKEPVSNSHLAVSQEALALVSSAPSNSKAIVSFFDPESGQILQNQPASTREEHLPAKLLSSSSLRVSEDGNVAFGLGADNKNKARVLLYAFAVNRPKQFVEYDLSSVIKGSKSVDPSALALVGVGDYSCFVRLSGEEVAAFFVNKEVTSLVLDSVSTLATSCSGDCVVARASQLDSGASGSIIDLHLGPEGADHWPVYVNGSMRGSVEAIFAGAQDKVLMRTGSHSLLFTERGKIRWTREEGLGVVDDWAMFDFPQEVSGSHIEGGALQQLQIHWNYFKLYTGLEKAGARADSRTGILSNHRDARGFNRLLVLLSSGANAMYAIHTGNGQLVWQKFLSDFSRVEPQMLRWGVHEITVMGGCKSQATLCFQSIDVQTGSVRQVNILDVADESAQMLLSIPSTRREGNSIHLIGDDPLNIRVLGPMQGDNIAQLRGAYYHIVDKVNGIIKGNQLTLGLDGRLTGDLLWTFSSPLSTEEIVYVTSTRTSERTQTPARVLGDRSLLHKYLNRNAIFVAALSRQGGYLSAYVLDTVTGQVIHRVVRNNAANPVMAVFSENWLTYSFWNTAACRTEVSVVELFLEDRDTDALKFENVMRRFLKPGGYSPTLFSSYDGKLPKPLSQSYFFSQGVNSLAYTESEYSITSKQVLIGTDSGQVYTLDRKYVDARRPAKPGKMDREEGLLPYSEILPFLPQNVLNDRRRISGLRGIVSFPTRLESTSLVFAHGLDLFFTRTSPSQSFDVLGEKFNRPLLILTVLSLTVATFLARNFSVQRDLARKWR